MNDMILPSLDGLSLDELQEISNAIENYSVDLANLIVQKRLEHISKLRDTIASANAELAALQATPTSSVKVANPSTPKYRDPDRPENTWAGRGKQPGWLKEKIEAGYSLDDFLIGKPQAVAAEPTSPDDPGF